MSSWILSIIGIVFISIIMEIILPNGKTNKFIKSIFSVFLLFIFISPIKDLIHKFSNTTFNEDNIKIDENFLYDINLAKNESNQILIQNRLKNKGIEGVNVVICNNLQNYDYSIEKIYIDITNLVITDKNQHINKYEVITNTILELINIEKDKIVFNEWNTK